MMTSKYGLSVGLFATLGVFLYGFDTGIATTTIAQKSWIEYMDNPAKSLVGAVASIYISGELLGAVAQTILGDRLGRKGFMTFCCFFVTLGTCLQTASWSLGSFLAGRGLAGIGVGGFLGTVLVYLSEISLGRQRGVVTGFAGCALVCGSMVSNWVGLGCSFLPYGQSQWRLALGLQIPWGVMLCVGLWTFMPESPRQLVWRGNIAEARRVFDRLNGNRLSTYEEDAEFAIMVTRINYEKTLECSYAETFRRYHRRSLIAIGTQIWAMTTGPAVILYFQTILYRDLGIMHNMVLVLTGIYGTVGFLANAFCVAWLSDRLGRRTLFLIGLAAVVVDLVYLAIMTLKFQNSDNKVGKGFTILGIYAFAMIFNGLLNSPVGTYCSEICPLEIRNKVSGMASMAHFVINIALTEAGPTALATIKQNYYYVFAACSAIAWVVVYFFYPETRNKTLEDIGIAFGDAELETENVPNVESSAGEKTHSDHAESVQMRHRRQLGL